MGLWRIDYWLCLGRSFHLVAWHGARVAYLRIVDDVLQRHVHDPCRDRQQLLDDGRRYLHREFDQRRWSDSVCYLFVGALKHCVHCDAIRTAFIVRWCWSYVHGGASRHRCGKCGMGWLLGLHRRGSDPWYDFALAALEQRLCRPRHPPS